MKLIKISSEQQEDIIANFTKYLTNARLCSNTINYSITISPIVLSNNLKPIVNISTKAYLKMITLIQKFNTEVGWHGIVYRNERIFAITDILVYPQTVTSGTITTDDIEYATWLLNFQDNIFNNIRFQCHSHVNMGIQPSQTDITLYHNILQTLHKDDYYIFAIMNKNLEINIWVYDLKQNVIFEKEDIIINIYVDEKESLTSWLENILPKIKQSACKYPLHKDYISDDETHLNQWVLKQSFKKKERIK